jgi:hypothetical protein
MPSRWDLLLEQRPIPLVEHLLEEVAKLLANDLRGWPPPIEELDPALGVRFAPLLGPDVPRPEEALFEEAFRLARWELEREVEAVDEYMRNRRWELRGLAPDRKQALLFVSRWLVEQLLSLREYTHSKISRPMLIDCLERTARYLRAQRSGPTSPGEPA